MKCYFHRHVSHSKALTDFVTMEHLNSNYPVSKHCKRVTILGNTMERHNT